VENKTIRRLLVQRYLCRKVINFIRENFAILNRSTDSEKITIFTYD